MIAAAVLAGLSALTAALTIGVTTAHKKAQLRS